MTKVNVNKTTVKKVDEKDQVKELKGQLARALADYDNLRRRVDREKEEDKGFASLTLIVKILPVLDMFEQAQGHLQDSGLAIAIKEFEEVLESEGIIRIDTRAGDDFDEELHEAVEVVKNSKKPKGKIDEIVLDGWIIVDGPVIRYSKVKVK